MERGHQRATVSALSLHGVLVHRHIQHPAGQAEPEEACHQRRHVRRHAKRDRHQRDARAGREDRPSAPDPIDDPAGQQDDQDQARGRGEERYPQQAVRQLEVMLDRRDPGEPDAAGRAEHGKERHHCRPRASQLASLGAGGRSGTGLIGGAADGGVGGIPGGPGLDAPDNTRCRT